MDQKTLLSADRPRTWWCRRQSRRRTRETWRRRTCSRRASWWTDRRRSVWLAGEQTPCRPDWCCCLAVGGPRRRALSATWPHTSHVRTPGQNSAVRWRWLDFYGCNDPKSIICR